MTLTCCRPPLPRRRFAAAHLLGCCCQATWVLVSPTLTAIVPDPSDALQDGHELTFKVKGK